MQFLLYRNNPPLQCYQAYFSLKFIGKFALLVNYLKQYFNVFQELVRDLFCFLTFGKLSSIIFFLYILLTESMMFIYSQFISTSSPPRPSKSYLRLFKEMNPLACMEYYSCLSQHVKHELDWFLFPNLVCIIYIKDSQISI